MTRRQLLAGGVSVGLACATAGCSDSLPGLADGSGSDHDWPMYQHDAAHTGHTHAKGPTDDATVRWEVETQPRYLYRTPTVAGDTVYVGNRNGLSALDVESGEERWQVDRDARSPAVIEGSLYGADSINQDVYALDAGTGEERWAHSLEEGEIFAPPTVVDGTVYIGRMGADVDNPSHAVALDAETGEERWRTALPSGLWGGAPVIVDGTVYLADYRGDVLAVSADDGTEEWTIERDTANASSGYVIRSPAVGDGSLYVPSGDLITIDTETGEEQWRVEGLNVPASDVIVAEETVYVTSRDGHVYALSVDDGDTWWRFQIEDLETRTKAKGAGTSPVVAGGVLYVGGLKGTVYALEEA